jgi:hypothetical protein
MNKRRLLKLAALLEADAEKTDGIKFDLGSWGAVDGAEKMKNLERFQFPAERLRAQSAWLVFLRCSLSRDWEQRSFQKMKATETTLFRNLSNTRNGRLSNGFLVSITTEHLSYSLGTPIVLSLP